MDCVSETYTADLLEHGDRCATSAVQDDQDLETTDVSDMRMAAPDPHANVDIFFSVCQVVRLSRINVGKSLNHSRPILPHCADYCLVIEGHRAGQEERLGHLAARGELHGALDDFAS